MLAPREKRTPLRTCLRRRLTGHPVWTYAEESFLSRRLSEALLLSAVFFAGVWSIRVQEIGYVWMEWLRANFFIFTREPLLQLYVHLFAETFVLKSGAVLGLALYLALRREDVPAALGLTFRLQNYSPAFLKAFWVLCAGVAWWEGMDPLTPDLPTPLFFQESATLGNTLAVLSVVLIAPVTEEIVFRGFLFPAFSRAWGRGLSILATSALFAAAHAPQVLGSAEHLAVIFGVGFLLTWQRAVTGSTLYCIGLHALYNGALTLAGFIRYSTYGF